MLNLSAVGRIEPLCQLSKGGRGPGLLALGGIGYGLLLYLVNFQVLGRIFFEWFTNPMGPPQGFEVLIHAVFGLLLVPFFLGPVVRPSRLAHN